VKEELREEPCLLSCVVDLKRRFHGLHDVIKTPNARGSHDIVNKRWSGRGWRGWRLSDEATSQAMVNPDVEFDVLVWKLLHDYLGAPPSFGQVSIGVLHGNCVYRCIAILAIERAMAQC
jgi:hypothetical protein